MDNTPLLTIVPDCHCGWQEPYGFVPEADCPKHDKPEFVARMNALFGAASKNSQTFTDSL